MKDLNSSRRKSAIAVIAVMLALIAVLPLVLITSALLPAQFDETFLGEMRYKMERLKSTEGKRIIVIGGSSVPFALKSEIVQEYIEGYEVVDFGMYADLGTTVMFDFAKANIRKGDIVIVSPEQSAQTLSTHFSGEHFWQCADGDFSLFRYLSSERKERAALAFPSFAGKKLYYAANGKPTTDGVYKRSAFNEYGDISYPDREYNVMPDGYNPNLAISFDIDIVDNDFISELNSFAAFTKSKGADIYYRFAPVNVLAMEQGTTKADIDAYYDSLLSMLNFDIMGNPHRSVMEGGWFYDTNFHLNNSGAVVFTKALIEDIKLLLGDSTPTDIALPAMPKAPDASVYDGDNSHAHLFTYREQGNGYVISGIKSDIERNLILPCAYEGKPIIGVDENVLCHLNVTSVTIQPNIRLLRDGMFNGCASLERVILTGAPTDYTVGNNFRLGASFNIQVPEGLVASYKLNYSWQMYARYIV